MTGQKHNSAVTGSVPHATKGGEEGHWQSEWPWGKCYKGKWQARLAPTGPTGPYSTFFVLSVMFHSATGLDAREMQLVGTTAGAGHVSSGKIVAPLMRPLPR